jgi:hypothetical protein
MTGYIISILVNNIQKRWMSRSMSKKTKKVIGKRPTGI